MVILPVSLTATSTLSIVRQHSMEESTLRDILARIKLGELTIDQAVEKLRDFPVAEIGEARIDTHRELRLGFPEVIFCDGKSDEQILSISRRMVELGQSVLATRISKSAADRLVSEFENARCNDVARTVFIEVSERKSRSVKVAVITAGTADIPVAEEAAVTCDALGCTGRAVFRCRRCRNPPPDRGDAEASGISMCSSLLREWRVRSHRWLAVSLASR